VEVYRIPAEPTVLQPPAPLVTTPPPIIGPSLFESPGATLRLGGHDLEVPRAEHLAAMKVHAMKNDPGRTLQEMADIRFLLQLDGVDEGEIREYFEEAGLREKFDEIKRSI
jgi:hypothetical protein